MTRLERVKKLKADFRRGRMKRRDIYWMILLLEQFLGDEQQNEKAQA